MYTGSSRGCHPVMKKSVLIDLLQERFRGAELSVTDISGSGKYYRITIRSCVFDGKSVLDRQRYFYSTVWSDLKRHLSGVTLNLMGGDDDVAV